MEDPIPAPSSTDTPGTLGENGVRSITSSVQATGNPLIDGVLEAGRWSGAISYSDPDNASDYPRGYESDLSGNGIDAQREGFSRLNPVQLAAVHKILSSGVLSVAGFTDLDIGYAAPGSGTATLRIANSGDAGTAYAYYPSDGINGGDAFFGNDYDGTVNSLKAPVAGNYAWHTFTHELGHTLGLKHGHETGGPGNTALPADRNSVEYSVMTYATFVGDDLSGYKYEDWGAPQTWMTSDIAALQHMYGADFTASSGDTAYAWSPSSGNTLIDGQIAIQPGANRIFATLWDGGGTDTYDLSAYATNLSIDLKPGASSLFSSLQVADLGGGPNAGFARGNIFNPLLYRNDVRSLIENAIGGSGDDTLLGNQGVNALNGARGNDTLHGDAGADILIGGAGADFMAGGPGDDIYSVDSAQDATAEFLSQGIDGVYAGVNWTLQSNFEVLFLVSAGLNGAGNASDNWIYGNASGNRLEGGGGNDALYGFGGADTLIGQGGADLLVGGAGNDVYSFDDPNDRIQELGNDGADTVFASLTTRLPNGVESLILVGSSAVDGAGNAATNWLYGSAENNVLNGAGGADFLQGLGGNDSFVLTRGQTDGEIIADFDGAGPLGGDNLRLVGYAPSALLTALGPTQWQVSDGTIAETFTLSNAASLDGSDYFFV